MVQVVKEIKGHDYIYEVTWNREKKKQVWKYRGKVTKNFDDEKFKEDLYLAIKKDQQIRIPKKDLKNLKKVIEEVVDKYNEYLQQLPHKIMMDTIDEIK